MGIQTIQVDKLMELGVLFKEKRNALGLEREEIALKIKVSTKILYALEEALTDSLPQPIFALGFARSYAQALGEDSDIVRRLLQEAFPHKSLDNIDASLTAAAREQAITINQTSNANFSLIFLILAILLLGGLAFGGYHFFGEEIKTFFGGAVRNGAETVPSRTASRPSADHTPPAVQTAPAPQNETQTAARQEETVGDQNDFPPSLSSQSNTRPNASIPAGTRRVVLFAKAECWIGAEFDDTGQRNFVLDSGQTFALDFKNRLKLTLGNSGVIEMSYNGQPYALNGRFREARIITLPPQ